MLEGLYWWVWFGATILNGLVAGFMLCYGLLLGRFLSWTVGSAKNAGAYAEFRATKGKSGIWLFYILSGLQTLLGIGFFVVSVVMGKYLFVAVIAAIAAPLWQIIYFVSGFASAEKKVLGSVAGASEDAVKRYMQWNTSLHIFYALLSFIAFAALVSLALL